MSAFESFWGPVPFLGRERDRVQLQMSVPPFSLEETESQTPVKFSVPILLLSRSCLPQCNLLPTGWCLKGNREERYWGSGLSHWTHAYPCSFLSRLQHPQCYTTPTPLTDTGMILLFFHMTLETGHNMLKAGHIGRQLIFKSLHGFPAYINGAKEKDFPFCFY